MIPDRADIEATIASAIRKALNREVGEITLDSSLVTDLAVDSLDLVELVMEFEEAFGITIPDEDYEKIKSIGDAVKYIEEKK